MNVSILEKSNNWEDFKSQLSSLEPKKKGDAFEYITKFYLQLDPKYATKLKKVWLYDEIPSAVQKKLNLPLKDQGIDLVAQTKDGEYWTIQCKYKTDETKPITWREISTFTGLAFGICKNITFGLVCTTADRYAKLLKTQDNIGFCTGDVWRELDEDFFKAVREKLQKRVPRITPLKPRPHQRRAIRNAHKHYIKEGEHRGKMIMPCGAGKSLAAYWIAEKLDARRIVIAVPSLALIRQTLQVWLRETYVSKKDVDWITVCSDESAGKISRDDLAVLTQDLGVPAITDPKDIAKWLKKRHRGLTVVFTTYQSGKVLAKASRMAKIYFDLGVMDEAHKTVGSKDKTFAHLLFDKNINIKSRIFMTATERRYLGIKEKIISMDDPEIYGDTFELLTFKEALEQDPPILSDYKIITLLVSKEEVAHIIRENTFVKPTKGKWDEAIEAESLASLIALRKAMKERPVKHAISFHNGIERAKVFGENQDIFSESYPSYGRLATYHVSGAMPTSQRANYLRDFQLSRKALITNARCLTEGVDVPNIDCVLFADPKRSTIDIVQAVGRALRPAKGKKFGYVLVPVLVEDNQEAFFENTAFSAVLMTLRALASNDERIIEYFRAIANRKRYKGRRVQIEIDEKIAKHIDAKAFANAIELKAWSRLAKLSWMPFEEAREFVHRLNLKSQSEWFQYYKSSNKPKDIPTTPSQIYKNEWKGYGDWLGTGTVAPQDREYLPFKKARRIVHKLNLKRQKEWREYSKSGKKPVDIPANPNQPYKNKGWKGWGDWLGTGSIATFNRKYLPFKRARRIVYKLNLKGVAEWYQYCKSDKKPDNIPTAPDQVYKNEWKGMGDWLGTGTIASKDRIFLPFKKARTFVRKLNIKSHAEWGKYYKSGNRPEDIPAAPNQVYVNEWKGWGDWLGTGSIATFNRKYLPFKKARRIVHKLNLKGQTEWHQYCKSGKKPDNIPANPNRTYENEWKGYGDWLGTGSIAPKDRNFLPFKKARAFVHRLNIKSQAGWGEYRKSGKRPDNIPSTPSKVYENEWKGWGDWFGTGTIAPKDREFLPFKKARAFVHRLNLKGNKEWRHYCKDGKKPVDIPANPDKVYENEWKGWGDWLGTGTIALKDREFLPFRKARAFVHRLNLKSNKEWRHYSKDGKKPVDIPANPDKVYKNEWKGYGDWLGTGTIAPQDREFLPFRKARAFVHGLNLKGRTEWRQYCKSGKNPDNIPANPNRTYEKEWKGMGDWLGKGTKHVLNKFVAE